MTIRHLVARDQVKNGIVTDPSTVRHGIIRAGAVDDLAGRVDLESHLDPNLDHRLDPCLVVESLEPGSPIVLEEGEWTWARLGR